MPWLIAALLVLFAPAALACECQDISAGDAFDRADIVFYGEYDGEEFKVLKKYKGKLKKKADY